MRREKSGARLKKVKKRGGKERQTCPISFSSWNILEKNKTNKFFFPFLQQENQYLPI